MNNPLPPKVQKMLEQVTQIVQPAATKAAGPVLVNLNRESGDGSPDKQTVFVQQSYYSRRQA